MSSQYPNSGRLSSNKYKEAGDKKPDLVGDITMTRQALKGLLDEHPDDEIVIKLSAWNMSGNYGPWIRLAWNNYKPKTEQTAPPVQKPLNIDSEDIPF